MGISLDSSTAPTRLTSAPTACQNWSNANTRCDTATDYTNGLPGPQVTSVGALNDIQVKVDPTGTANYQLLRAYQFSYEQTSEIVGVDDPISGSPENVAGSLDLTKIQQFGTDWTNNCTTTCAFWPAMQFTYSGSARSTPNTNCLSPGNFPCTDSGEVLQERYADRPTSARRSPAPTSAWSGLTLGAASTMPTMKPSASAIWSRPITALGYRRRLPGKKGI